MGNDVFAQIASNGIGGRSWLLSEPEPARYEVRRCELKRKLTGEYVVPQRSYDRQTLAEDLVQLRHGNQRFLQRRF